MYIKEFDIVLDIKNSTEQEPFEVVQGDSQSNLLNISMTDGLEPYDLTGTTAEIVFYKSDSTTVQQTEKTGVVILNAPDGKIQCTLKTNTIACPGKVVAEVRVLSDEVLLTSSRFEFYVRKSLINDKTIESADEFPVLTQLMKDTSSLIDKVNQIEKQVPENVVSRIDAMESGKVDKTDIVQTDTISDASKVPSSVVTNKLSSQVTELNKNIQGTLPASSKVSHLGPAGWYRVAVFEASDIGLIKGSYCNSVNISIKRSYNAESNEYYNILLMSIFNKSQFVLIGKLVNVQDITKIRHTIDVANLKAYIEIYYTSQFSNDLQISLYDTKSVTNVKWNAITAVATEETVDGVSVVSSTDLTTA
jgi:hypothetical protein